MPVGHMMTMPVLIVNMGGEMVYILEQRLQAQKIPELKGQKVLNDVVRTMYYPRFIEELFKPQEMYSIQSTRQIFDRLAHSSIMRLNESSMDKLYDLMAMGFKYQIQSCMTPTEVVDITHNHLDVLKRLVSTAPAVLELLDECVRQMHTAYGGMCLADHNVMRQSLCTFFQDRKVKVSLFLHDHTQNSDGSIVVASGGMLPLDAQVPGGVRYFSGGLEVGHEMLSTVASGAWRAPTGLRTHLGSNVYDKDRPSPAEQPLASAAAPSLPEAPPPLPPPSESARTAAAVGELNHLASLLGSQSAPSTDHFKLESLFGKDMFGKDASGASLDIIEIDGRASAAHAASLDAVRQQMDLGGMEGGAPGAPDDLLDLMDNA